MICYLILCATCWTGAAFSIRFISRRLQEFAKGGRGDWGPEQREPYRYDADDEWSLAYPEDSDHDLTDAFQPPLTTNLWRARVYGKSD